MTPGPDKPTENVWHGQTHSAEQTVALGRAIAAVLRSGDVIALTGELGAGKTQIVRGLAQGLGADPTHVASPTFVIVHEYTTPSDSPGLIHIDAYRLKSLADLESIGWETAQDGGHGLADAFTGSVVAIEWADRLQDQLPPDRLEVRLEHTGPDHRTARATGRGSWSSRMRSVIAHLDPS